MLVVGSPAYLRRYESRETGGGHGAVWEGAILRRELYAQRTNLRFLPIVFDDASIATCLPEPLRDTTRYRLDIDYEKLLRVLINQPAIVAAPIGPRPTLGSSTLSAAPTTPHGAQATRSASTPPLPARREAESQALGRQLGDAYARKQQLAEAGEATDSVVREIVELKRRHREGGQLRSGDRLGGRRSLPRAGGARPWRVRHGMEGKGQR